jgi:Domain of unknown function (DUF4157)
MQKLLVAATLSFGITALFGTAAKACDPNEECSRCLASTFGHCITHGNDPICEARKKACQVAPAVVNTPGSPFGPGGPLQQGGPMGLSVPQIKQCVSNLSACPAQIIARIGYETVRPIVDHYIGFLQNQAGNNVYRLDDSIIGQIQQFYSVDLHSVVYATGINTLHGANITIGSTVYFVRPMNFNDPNDAWTLYHELEHVVQYAARGGVEPFLAEYILKAGGSILRGGNSIDIHDNIDLENAANAKANQVSNSGGAGQGPSAVMQNPPFGNICRTPAMVCMLTGSGPIGIGCYCGTPYGPANGVVTLN